MDGAWEAFERAVELAEQLNDERSIAAATRELGVIEVARMRVWFIGLEQTGGHLPILQELATHHVGGYLKIAPEHTEDGPRGCVVGGPTVLAGASAELLRSAEVKRIFLGDFAL
jgi:hypothetical protein